MFMLTMYYDYDYVFIPDVMLAQRYLLAAPSLINPSILIRTKNIASLGNFKENYEF